MNIINIIFNRNNDWKKPIIKDSIIKSNLSKTKKEVLEDLKREQVEDPKALFYINRFIDSKFDKCKNKIYKDYYTNQNTLDELYATGLSETMSLFEEYKSCLKEMNETSKSYEDAIKRLDKKYEISNTKYDDNYKLLVNKFSALDKELDWRN